MLGFDRTWPRLPNQRGLTITAKTTILYTVSNGLRKSSVYPLGWPAPKEQPPRKLSGKWTVVR